MASGFVAMCYAFLNGRGIDTKGMSPKEAINRYNEWNRSVGRSRGLQEERTEREKLESKYTSEYIRPFKIQLFAAKLSEQSEQELRKSKKSFEKRICEHKAKMENPKAVVPNWGNMSQREQAGLIHFWRKEIQEATRRLQEAEERLNERKK